MSYFDSAGRPDVLSGGVRMIPVATPAGRHRVGTKRTGNNPATKVLLLHGGPGATHEYLLGFDSYLPGAGVEYHYYDQLGSGWSDRPDDPSLCTIERFVDAVEQVRVALGLSAENFVLYGQSWGGLLAIEYALAHQQHLKGLVISSMMASFPAYNRYAAEVLIAQQDPATIAEIKARLTRGHTAVVAHVTQPERRRVFHPRRDVAAGNVKGGFVVRLLDLLAAREGDRRGTRRQRRLDAHPHRAVRTSADPSTVSRRDALLLDCAGGARPSGPVKRRPAGQTVPRLR